MKTRYAGPSGTCAPGKTITVDATEAKDLVNGKYAEYVGGIPEETTELTGPVDNSYDSETGELIGYCSIVPASVGEEHSFGDIPYVFDREEEGMLYFVKLKSELPTIEVFAELKADEQKAIIVGLKIEGDDSNDDKRKALYAAYLEANK